MAKYQFRVEVEPQYLPEQSAPAETVTALPTRSPSPIPARSPAQLISRHWIIANAAGEMKRSRAWASSASSRCSSPANRSSTPAAAGCAPPPAPCRAATSASRRTATVSTWRFRCSFSIDGSTPRAALSSPTVGAPSYSACRPPRGTVRAGVNAHERNHGRLGRLAQALGGPAHGAVVHPAGCRRRGGPSAAALHRPAESRRLFGHRRARRPGRLFGRRLAVAGHRLVPAGAGSVRRAVRGRRAHRLAVVPPQPDGAGAKPAGVLLTPSSSATALRWMGVRPPWPKPWHWSRSPRHPRC